MKLDKFEAKTLMNCTKALMILVQSNVEKYLENELSFRTSLFKQFTYILDLSYQVYKGFSNSKKQLYQKNKDMPMSLPVKTTNLASSITS